MKCEYYYDRLCRKLVELGFGDLEVKIGNKIISSIKSILVNGNETLKKIVLDSKFVGVLELYEECCEIGYYEMEKYYSGGELVISKDTVCEILLFCLCYNEKEIIKDCYEFVNDNIDDEILMKLIHICNIFPDGLKEIEELRMMEMEKRGYKYLYNNEYLMRLEMNNLVELLNMKDVIILNELWLLNRLIEWYKFKNNNNNNMTNNPKMMNDLKNLIEDHINVEMINENDLENDKKMILKDLNIELKSKKTNNNFIYLYKIKDEKVQNLIVNNYNKEDSDESEFNDEEKEYIRKMKEEDLNEIIMKLIEMNKIKITEMVLMIIKYQKLKIENKRTVLDKLCIEYNENKRNRTLKCLCLFVDDRKSIRLIEDHNGKNILFQMLNKSNYLNSKSKQSLMKYIKENKLSLKEEEEMLKIILDKELLEELKNKEISSFSYPEYEYILDVNEEISIIPSFDGNRCEFSISPSLPDGIEINKESGIINGKVNNGYEKQEYEISCKNVKNEKKFKISLEFLLARFENDAMGVIVSDNGKLITGLYEEVDNHCYLNLKMESGIYHIEYQYHQDNDYDYISLGLSTDNTYSGIDICYRSTTCNYRASFGQSIDITDCCYIGTVVNSNPKFYYCGGDSIYEIIVDMNKREFWISHNNSSPVLLVKDLPSPLYPYATLAHKGDSVELLSVSHQD